MFQSRFVRAGAYPIPEFIEPSVIELAMPETQLLLRALGINPSACHPDGVHQWFAHLEFRITDQGSWLQRPMVLEIDKFGDARVHVCLGVMPRAFIRALGNLLVQEEVLIAISA